jgi:hypothetical protein
MNPPGAWVTVQVVRNLARRAVDWQRRHPTAADAVVAALFTVAGLVSVSVSLAAARDLDVRLEQPSTAAVVVTTLAVTLPLAGRRRLPLSAATVVTVAFVVERVLLQSVEPYVTVYSVWLALYSAVVYGRPGRRRRLVLALNVGLLLGEVVRELFFVARRPSSRWSSTPGGRRPPGTMRPWRASPPARSRCCGCWPQA